MNYNGKWLCFTGVYFWGGFLFGVSQGVIPNKVLSDNGGGSYSVTVYVLWYYKVGYMPLCLESDKQKRESVILY